MTRWTIKIRLNTPLNRQLETGPILHRQNVPRSDLLNFVRQTLHGGFTMTDAARLIGAGFSLASRRFEECVVTSSWLERESSFRRVKLLNRWLLRLVVLAWPRVAVLLLQE